MTGNAPLLLGLKATWRHAAPFPGSGGYLSVSSVSDAYTPENIDFYGSKGDEVGEVWAIYVTPDRRSLFTVNMDGTLRAMHGMPEGAAPKPHPHWA
jgi:hypothetical protein